MAKQIILKVVKTKTAWRVKSDYDLSGWAGSESEDKKWAIVNRANKLANNLSKEKGVSVRVEVYSSSGVLQTKAEW